MAVCNGTLFTVGKITASSGPQTGDRYISRQALNLMLLGLPRNTPFTQRQPTRLTTNAVEIVTDRNRV